MKSILLFYMALALSICSFAKPIPDRKVPDLVKHSFHKNNPGVEQVKWGITDEGYYLAVYSIGGQNYTSYYNKNGDFIESGSSVNWHDIPYTARMEIYQLNNFGNVQDVLKIRNNDRENFYLVFVRNNFKEYKVVLDSKGYLVQIVN